MTEKNQEATCRHCGEPIFYDGQRWTGVYKEADGDLCINAENEPRSDHEPAPVATESGELFISSVQPGDTVIRLDRTGRAHLATVDRVTAKMIIIRGDRYRKPERGMQAEMVGRYPGALRLAYPGEIERLRAEAEERAAAYAAARAEEREALRGRTAGFLLAAEEALRGALKDEPENEPGNKLGRELEFAVHDVRYDLESAEKSVRSAAESLRDQADQLDAAVERDADYVGTFYSLSIERVEEKRAAAVKHGWQVVKLVARFLGVEVKELVAPMAAPEPAEGEEGGAA